MEAYQAEPSACGSAGAIEGRLLGGRYRVGRLLGSGAMGHVYAAEHVELGRACAVKVIREPEGEREQAAQRQDETIARFRTEALAASRLDHPNVLRVLDFGRDPGDGLHYLVTEHLDGVDLVDLIAQEHLDPTRVVRIARQLCSALQHAHDRRVVHRDVKPENVRIVKRYGDDGEVLEVAKLMDFGTALIDGTPAARLVIGTPAYMSPEQALGEAADARSDVYALGVLLFELTTGRIPFERSCAVALAAAHVECPPPAPSSINENIDPALEALILRCMQKDPAARPQSARAVREALDRYLTDKGEARASAPSLLPVSPPAVSDGDFAVSTGSMPGAVVTSIVTAVPASVRPAKKRSRARTAAGVAAAALGVGVAIWLRVLAPSAGASTNVAAAADRTAGEAIPAAGHIATPAPVDVEARPATSLASPPDATAASATPVVRAPSRTRRHVARSAEAGDASAEPPMEIENPYADTTPVPTALAPPAPEAVSAALPSPPSPGTKIGPGYSPEGI